MFNSKIAYKFGKCYTYYPILSHQLGLEAGILVSCLLGSDYSANYLRVDRSKLTILTGLPEASVIRVLNEFEKLEILEKTGIFDVSKLEAYLNTLQLQHEEIDSEGFILVENQKPLLKHLKYLCTENLKSV